MMFCPLLRCPTGGRYEAASRSGENTAVKPYVEPDTACSQFAQRNGPSKLNAITVRAAALCARSSGGCALGLRLYLILE